MTSIVERPLATKQWHGGGGGCGRGRISTPSDQDPRKGVFLFGFVIVRKSPIIKIFEISSSLFDIVNSWCILWVSMRIECFNPLRLHLTLRVIKELEWRIFQCITLCWQSRNLRTEEPTRDRCASAQSEQVPRPLWVGWVACRQKWRNGFSRKMCSMWCIPMRLPLCGWLWMENAHVA